MLEQIPTVPQQPKKPCKNDRKTMLKKQALARYFYLIFFSNFIIFWISLGLDIKWTYSFIVKTKIN